MKLEKYHAEGKLPLPSVSHFIEYEKHTLIDVILHKDQMFKAGQELEYNGIKMLIYKKIKDVPIKTEAKITDRLLIRKCTFFCNKL